MNKPRTLVLLAALAMACVSAAQDKKPTDPPAATQKSAPQDPLKNPIQDESYRIQADDVITIQVQDVSEPSGTYTVGKDGRISVPLAGEVQIAGLTRKEIADLVASKLKKEIRNPIVTVNVTSSAMQRIYVMGTVSAPGIKDYKPKWRLTELIAASGGLASDPVRTKLVLFRTGSEHKEISMRKLLVDGDDSLNIEVQPGDVLNFSTDVMIRINVVGKVGRQGPVMVQEGQGVAEVLAAAGGAGEGARLSGVRLVRDGKEVNVDLYSIVNKGNPGLNLTVKDGDTLYVPDLLNRIAVIGMVGRPGPMVIPDGKVLTLTEALALAGGPTLRAKTDGVSLVRKGADGKATFQNYNYKAYLKGDKTFVDPVLQDGDILVMAQSGKAGAGELGSGMGFFGFLRGIFPFFP